MRYQNAARDHKWLAANRLRAVLEETSVVADAFLPDVGNEDEDES